MREDISYKYNKLINILRSYVSLAVAFSGGVDSTFLLKVAHDVMGDKCIAITINSEVFPERERIASEDFCATEGIERIEIKCNDLEIPGFRGNPSDRCYLCKKSVFSEIIKAASVKGIRDIAEGSNIDDEGDYRPGLKAINELGIKSPLREAGLTKDDIRQLSHNLGLSTWDKPSFACLASRFVYGEEISEEKLKMVDEAEKLLLEKGFSQLRVRIHEGIRENNNSKYYIARIEIPGEDMEHLLKCREEIVEGFKALGFDYISMDMEGFRTGSMNEVLL